jgi:CubicO group peptidase (beta-lactamase class C family)
MLQDGIWEGDTLLFPGWVDYLREPAVGSEGTYGAQTWLPGPDMPSLPKDAFMMRGFQDQRVFIIPSRQLVIVRLGHGVDKSTDFEGLVSRLLEGLESIGAPQSPAKSPQ